MNINYKSKTMLIISIIIFLMLVSGGLNVIYLTKTISGDPALHNNLGTIRGSIQRVSKLELNGVQEDGLIDRVDERFLELKDILLKKKSNKYQDVIQHLDELQNQWIDLKSNIVDYRENPSQENHQLLLEKSEKIWDKADHTVLRSQIATERLMGNYKLSFMLLFINLILIIKMLLFIRNYIQKTLEQMVNKDGLTMIYNRRYFDEYLTNELIGNKRAVNNDLCLMIFDIDHFKRVNDQYGHSAGDYVLKELTKIICRSLRKTDVFARIGGEEFSVIAPNTNLDGALKLAEKLRVLVEKHHFKRVGRITISIGITQYYHGDDTNSIYKRADQALYEAKNNGRNRCAHLLFEPATS